MVTSLDRGIRNYLKKYEAPSGVHCASGLHRTYKWGLTMPSDNRNNSRSAQVQASRSYLRTTGAAPIKIAISTQIGFAGAG